MKYIHIACGGTFDFFHAGHEAFLNKAFFISNKVSIGITSDVFANKIGKCTYNNFAERKALVEKFLTKKGLLKRAKVIKLEDVYGSTISDNSLQGIIVTKNSTNGAIAVNKLRRQSKLAPLDLVICELKIANDGMPISSSRIKAGEISPDGINYLEFLSKNNFTLPRKLRPTLGEPFGLVTGKITNPNDADLLVTIGDQTTSDALKAGILPDVSVIDYKIQRVKSFQAPTDLGFKRKIKIFAAINPKGMISKDLSITLHKSLNYEEKCVLVVDGEEDLAVLPAVLLAPIGTCVYYGLRNEGIVKILVDVDCKNNFLDLLKKFTSA